MNYYRDHESAFQPTSLRSRNTRVLWTELVKTSSSPGEWRAKLWRVPEITFRETTFFPRFFHSFSYVCIIKSLLFEIGFAIELCHQTCTFNYDEDKLEVQWK